MQSIEQISTWEVYSSICHLMGNGINLRISKYCLKFDMLPSDKKTAIVVLGSV